MARAFKPQIATGNDLFEGDVVYFAAQSTWSRFIADAEVAQTAEAAEDLLGRAAAFPDKVVGIYLADVTLDASGRPTPAHFREDFRMRGPSNRPEHARVSPRS